MRDEDFRDGLGLDNLNPPDIASFFHGAARRATEHLSALSPKRNTADLQLITDQLRSMTDQVADLTERLQSVGYSPAPPGPGPKPDHDGPATGEFPHPELAQDLQRFRSGSEQVAGLLSGIPFRGWASREELLSWSRQSVGDVALSLRSLADLVEEANERAASTTADRPGEDPVDP